MKTSFTNKEFKNMLTLVIEPERMTSIFNIAENIQTYANLEMAQVTILNSCGNDFIKYLDDMTSKVGCFKNKEEKYRFITEGFEFKNYKLDNSMKNIARLSILYIFHNCNKNNNKYGL